MYLSRITKVCKSIIGLKFYEYREVVVIIFHEYLSLSRTNNIKEDLHKLEDKKE